MKQCSRVGYAMRVMSGLCAVWFTGCGVESPNSTAAPPVSEQAEALHGGNGSGGSVDFGQWGNTPQHTAEVQSRGQRLRTILADRIYDPFIAQEKPETFDELLGHYQVPLLDGDDVFTMFKTGTYVSCDPPGSFGPDPCGPNAWNLETWNEKRLKWENGALVEKWNFATDWKPVPNSSTPFDFTGLFGWEPMFQPVLLPDQLVVPGASGSIYRIDRHHGTVLAHIDPFAGDPNVYLTGPIVADDDGKIFYSAIQLVPGTPWVSDVTGAWLVTVKPNGHVKKISYATLTAGVAPGANDACLGSFSEFVSPLPFPPSPTAVPDSFPCGSERPGVNTAPAIAPDGTVYVVSRAHFDQSTAFLIALDGQLHRKWIRSLKGLIVGGCGTPELPPNGTPGGCRAGANYGVDPLTNTTPAGQVSDFSTASPVVTPDGDVLFGTVESYTDRGHTMKFNRHGHYEGSYDFGWDITPAIWKHDGTYSIITKDNHYGIGYCFTDPVLCAGEPEHYDITQLDKHLNVEWKFTNTNTQSCQRQPDGSVSCVDDHPNGFEWCINAPGVDRDGVVYGNSEDGNVYAIKQGGIERERLFTQLAIGAAYTPLSIGGDGKIYAQNDGHLFVIGH